MAHLNEHYLSLKQSYLFSDIAKRVAAYSAAHPDASVIRMGIGDVTRPLAPAVVDAMKRACDEMGTAAGFHGYGPEQGYDFLRQAIASYYGARGVSIDAGEVFVSDGAKSDVGNITDIFSNDNVIMIPDPVYPVYVDSNLMLGRKILFLDATEENGFLPLPDGRHADLIYLCSPNNPTGAVYTREQLKVWVDYALEHEAVILFDAAYEAFISDDLPRSIYEIEGAKRCAIEFSSFSKTAGFTGTRCGYTVVPAELTIKVSSGERIPAARLWNRRQTTKFNGVPYIVQRGAEAVFTDEGMRQVRASIDYYKENGRVIAEAMRKLGVYFTGGENSAYIWFRCPNGMKSWNFFDDLLSRTSVVGTPGEGFGANGEGFFRLSAFSTHENTREAMRRLLEAYGK